VIPLVLCNVGLWCFVLLLAERSTRVLFRAQLICNAFVREADEFAQSRQYSNR
jgi:hypothetical protein